MATLGELAGPDLIQAECDEERLLQAYGDHVKEHGCKGLHACPIRRIIAHALKEILGYTLDLLKEADSRTEPLAGFVETARRGAASESTPPER